MDKAESKSLTHIACWMRTMKLYVKNNKLLKNIINIYTHMSCQELIMLSH
jgi:hypothetical protein